ncbi:MAG: MlaD family protein [Prevotella sp.]|nr:MlaD family protein [Prevotella sp.]
MKYFTKEVKIALVAIVAIVVLFIGMQFLKGMSVFSSNDVYYACFEDISGLSTSSPVYANGYRVGVVKGVEYDYEHANRIVAALDLDPKLHVAKGTRAEIVSDLLGNVKLELRFGEPQNGQMAKGDTIEGFIQEGLMSKAAQMVPQVEQMLPKLDSILASINTLVADPALSGTLHNAEKLTAGLNTVARQVNQLTAQLNREMPKMMSKAQGVLDNTETLTGNLSQINLDATMQKVDATLSSLQQLTSALNNPTGSVGMLLNDAQLYENLNSTMRSVDSLLIDFKLHPRRYINVSVFGKKAK